MRAVRALSSNSPFNRKKYANRKSNSKNSVMVEELRR